MREKYTGTLTDNDIELYVAENKLIVRNFSRDNIKQACYELRSSNVYYDLSNMNRKYVLENDDYILLKPKQLIVIIAHEELALPDNILGRVMTKGKLFSIGLLPINTYADPGFSGQLGIVFYNLSNNYIKIKQNEPIAKIEFSKLHDNVLSRYKGQHGYQTRIWPIPDDMILSDDEIRKDRRIDKVHQEINLAYGKDMGKVIERVFKYERRLIIATIFFILFSIIIIFILANIEKSILDPFYVVITGVISSLVTALLMFLATNLKRR